MNWEYRESMDCWVAKMGDVATYVAYEGNFSPSTSISAAWLVIKEMEKEWAWDMHMHNNAREVEVRIGQGRHVSISAPLSICIAALKALKIDQEEYTYDSEHYKA